MRTSNGRRVCCLAIVASMLAGCGSPMPRWQTPAVQDVREHNMAYGRAYAQAARAAYQRALDAEVGASRDLGTGLIGLGGVIAALAGFKAHRDAIAGAALLGGTAYAIGNWNISKQRQLVYLAGIEGINCSVKAVSAFDMPESDRLELNKALGELETQLADVAGKDAILVAARAKLSAADAPVVTADADQVLADSRKLSASARDVLVAGRKIAAGVYRAGGELVMAVDRIDKAVDTALLETLPDLSSIGKVVGGIAGFAGTLAPGSGVEEALTKAMKDSAKGPTIQSAQENTAEKPEVAALRAATVALAGASVALANASAKVRGLTAVFDPAATFAGLADCGVTVSMAFTAKPATINMKGGVAESYLVLLSGGTAPYRVAVQGNTPTGLTVVEPVAFDKSIHIVGSAELAASAGPVKLLVTDASNPAKSVEIEIAVGTAGSGGSTTPATAPSANTLVERIKKVEPFTVGAAKITVNKAEVKSLADGKVSVPVSCEPAGSSLAEGAVVAQLLQQKVAGSKIAADVSGDAPSKFKITGDCISPAAAAPQSASEPRARVAVAGTEEVRTLQRKLCLPAFLVDGIWGPTTQGAADQWRSRQQRPITTTPLSAEERNTILQASPEAVTKWCAA